MLTELKISEESPELAKLFVDAGIVVICAFISPFEAERKMARAMFEEGEFLEAFVDVPLEIAEKRDTKGLYRKARSGELPISLELEVPLKNHQIQIFIYLLMKFLLMKL